MTCALPPAEAAGFATAAGLATAAAVVAGETVGEAMILAGKGLEIAVEEATEAAFRVSNLDLLLLRNVAPALQFPTLPGMARGLPVAQAAAVAAVAAGKTARSAEASKTRAEASFTAGSLEPGCNQEFSRAFT